MERIDRTGRQTRTRVIGGILSIMMVAAAAGLIALTPWIFGFACTVVAAVLWCSWLEGHSG